MPELPSISRRRALAALGVTATGAGGYVAGVRTSDEMPDWLAGRECSPSPLVTSPTDWPVPRHDRANTGHAPARAGPDWPLERVWERDWPIANIYRTSSFVAANGVVLAILDSSQSAIVAFSISDGRVSWRQPIDDGQFAHGFAAGGTAFVKAQLPDSNTRVAALSLGDGSLQWTDGFSPQVPMTLADGRLIVFDRDPDESRDGRHFAGTAYDARTGTKCWRTVHDGWPFDAAVTNGQIVVPTRDAGLLALDAASGDRQWHSDGGGETVAIVDDLAITQRFPGEFQAVSLDEESIEWHVQSDHYLAEGTDDEGTQYARPDFEIGAVTTDVVVYTLSVHSDYPDRVQARDTASGDLVWDVGPEPEPLEFHGYSRPIAYGDNVLVVRYARRGDSEPVPDALLRLDSTTGTERGRLTFSDEHVLHPVVADGHLFVPTEERLITYN